MGKVEEYVGLQNVPFNCDRIQGFYGNKPTYIEIPIDLAIEAEEGMDCLQKQKEGGEKGATVQIYVDLRDEYIVSAIHFSDSSKLANKYDWAID